jgi:hypothetical protein
MEEGKERNRRNLEGGQVKKKHVSNPAGTGTLLNVTGGNYGTWYHDSTLD